MMTSVKRVTSHSKSFYCFFERFESYLVCARSFKSINSSSVSRKKYEDNFTPTPCKPLWCQNELVEIWLIELTEPSDPLNYKPFFQHCILQFCYFTCIFSCLYLCGTNSFVLKTELYFTFFWFGLVGHSVLQC